MPDRPCPTENHAGSRKIYQAVADGVDHQFSGLVDSQRVHDIGAMHGHGVRAKIEHRGDLFVGFSFHDHLQNFQLARGEVLVAIPFERRPDD